MAVLLMIEGKLPFAKMIGSDATLLITDVVYLEVEHFFVFTYLF